MEDWWWCQDTPLNPSFMHLHLGFDAAGMDAPELHHIVVPSWECGVDAEQARPPLLQCIRNKGRDGWEMSVLLWVHV